MNRRSFLASLAALAVVPRALLALRPAPAWVDVREYGALGDGVHDDWPAIQRAVAAVRAGGTVSFPPGRYWAPPR